MARLKCCTVVFSDAKSETELFPAPPAENIALRGCSIPPPIHAE